MNLANRKRVLWVFTAVTVLTLSISLFWLSRMSRHESNAAAVQFYWLPRAGSLRQTLATLNSQRNRQDRYTRDTKENQAKTDQSFNKLQVAADKFRKEHELVFHDAKEKEIFVKFTDAYDLYLAQHREVGKLVRAGENTEAEKLVTGPMVASFDQVEKQLQHLMDYQFIGANVSFQQIEEDAGTERTWVASFAIIALLLAIIGFAFWFARLISKTLGRALAPAEKL